MLSQIDIEALVDRLQSFALGDNPGAMSERQVDAALRLLNSALPDLHEVTLNDAGWVGCSLASLVDIK